MRIGLAGLGRMGVPMAERLLAADHDLVVWNRTRARAEELASGAERAASGAERAASGAERAASGSERAASGSVTVAGSPAELLAAAEVALTVVADDAALE